MSDTFPPDPSAQPAVPSSTPAIGPGWLQDPTNPALLRYWDGTQWTENTSPAPVAQAPRSVTTIESDKSGKPIQATTAWIIAICTLGYMLPWAIAASRGKSNAGAIGWVNLLAGWTVIGWIIALVMAAGSHQKYAVTR